MSTFALSEPRPRLPADRPGWHAFMAMAFRPFYLAAASFGALSILAWLAGFAGGGALPGALWHGHEMIWGYAGAVIVGFLLTAVATWTGQPPLSGWPLAGLAAMWLAARVAAAFESGAPLMTGLLSVSFFLAAAPVAGVAGVARRVRGRLRRRRPRRRRPVGVEAPGAAGPSLPGRQPLRRRHRWVCPPARQ